MGIHMTLMNNITVKHVFFAHGHVCDACVPFFFVVLARCA